MIAVNFEGMATIIGGLGGSVILAAAVTAALSRLWHYRVVRLLLWPVTFPTKAVKAAVMEAAAVSAEAFVRPIVADEINRLMTPNGGNSVADVSRKVDQLTERVERIAEEAAARRETFRREDSINANQPRDS